MKSAIGKFIADDSYRKWCQALQSKPQHVQDDNEMTVDDHKETVVSAEMMKVQYELAEAWKTFILVAVHHHVGFMSCC